MALVALLDDGEDRLVDTQWQTPHLASLGVAEVPRAEYLDLLAGVLTTPDADFGRAPDVRGHREEGRVSQDSRTEP
jgi:leucyl/phenylalanyl-tRNA---protein transferase